MARGGTYLPTRPKGEIRNLKPIFRYLKPYRLQLFFATVALIFTSGSVLGLGSGLRYLIDEGIAKGNSALLGKALVVLAGVTILLAVMTYVRFYFISFVGERVIADIRSDVFRHLVGLHIGFFEVTRIGEIVSRTDIAAQECVDHLLLEALAGNARDNITAILLRVAA